MAKSTASKPRPRRERGSINVDEIVNGAFEVAAEVSLDNLSMPMLAKHLDVGVTSIYWYFRKKDDLLDARADRALHEYNFTDPPSTPRTGANRCANTLRPCGRHFATILFSATSS